jgi:outer membrane protein OmpA-like peptidoglycan-associated protein
MGSKIVALTAIIVSGAFFYYCIDTKKEKIFSSCNVVHPAEEKNMEDNAQKVVLPVVENKSTNETVPPVPVEEEKIAETVETKETEKSDPAFGVMFGEKVNIVGMFSPEAKEKALIHFIETYCADRECINDIRFSNDIKTVEWQQNMVSLIQMFEEENIEKGSLYINSNVLHIEGEIATISQKKHLESLIAKLKENGLFVEDETIDMITKVPVTENDSVSKAEVNETIDQKEKNIPNSSEIEEKSENTKTKTDSVSLENNMDEMKVEISENKISKQEEVVESVTSIPKQTSTDTKGSLSEKISALLIESPITFDAQVKNLTIKSKETLSKITELIKEKPSVSVEIIGYENSGDPILDMVISQKKADIVANYLYTKGLRKLKSKGLGAKNSKMQIEIKIKQQ